LRQNIHYSANKLLLTSPNKSWTCWWSK